jgi:hypothetical protein
MEPKPYIPSLNVFLFMNKFLKIGIVVAALVLISVIAIAGGGPLMFIGDLLALVALIRLTGHSGKPKADHLVIGFIVVVLVFIALAWSSSLLTSAVIESAEQQAMQRAALTGQWTGGTPTLGILGVYADILGAAINIDFVMFVFLLVLTYRYRHYK